jgi:hypothetical protein
VHISPCRNADEMVVPCLCPVCTLQTIEEGGNVGGHGLSRPLVQTPSIKLVYDVTLAFMGTCKEEACRLPILS